MSAPPSSPSSDRLPPWLLPALLVAAIVTAYAPALHAPFIFDDTAAVVRNPTIRSLASLQIFNPPADGGTTTGRPLVNASFALNYAVSGDDPWSYHALNFLIHAAAALTLLGLLRRTFFFFNFESSTAVAFATALLWALHPLATESVTCIAQRTESLCGLLLLFTLYAFVRGWFAWSVIACALGMATKEVMVVAPLLVLLYDRTFVARSFAAVCRTRGKYYAALAATWLILLALLARAGGSRGVAAGFGHGVSVWHYLLTQCDALVRYLRLTVVPWPLVLDYGDAVVRSPAEVWWQGLLILALLGATLFALVRKPVGGFVGAAFFLLLAPSSSFVPLVTQTIAEHRMYLALAALLAGAAGLTHRALGSRTPLVLTLLALVAGGATWARNVDYHSEIALWQSDVDHHPHARALTALGVALAHAGRPAEALPLFERALALDPTHLSAQRNRALALLQLGRATEAAAILTSLPAREPGEAEEFFAMGNAFAREKKFPEAAAAYARTLTLEPNHLGAHANLGNVLLVQGRIREAIAEYEAVLRLRPDDTRTRENLQLAREALR